MTNNIAKLTFVVSDTFLDLVNDNIHTLSVDAIIRLAERRFQFRNPKLDGIEVTVEDIERAIAIRNGDNDSTDRLVNVYNWFKRTGRTITGPVADVWARYKSYITATKAEKLWGGSGVLESGSSAEKEFTAIVKGLKDSEDN